MTKKTRTLTPIPSNLASDGCRQVMCSLSIEMTDELQHLRRDHAQYFFSQSRRIAIPGMIDPAADAGRQRVRGYHPGLPRL